ncbi:opsin-3-like [Belonocnema kinseyi]|uniref:opsin-3-like n=1 Tax=Belonocnema kinseyi TaxID=2817044 RepID=UPI00143CC9CE|nr:opsin-3-like [Belonocnema kinseyi]
MSINNTTDLQIRLDHQFSQITFIGSGIALATIGITGFTLNLLVIIFILQDMKNLWTPVNIVLVNLSISDALMAAIGVPFAAISALSGGWPWSYELCTWYGWLMSSLGIASIGNLTAMAVDRCILITRPLKPFTTSCDAFMPNITMGESIS